MLTNDFHYELLYRHRFTFHLNLSLTLDSE